MEELSLPLDDVGTMRDCVVIGFEEVSQGRVEIGNEVRAEIWRPGVAESINNFIEPHFRWIERQVNDDGGWPEQPGKRSSTMTTAEAVSALLERPDLHRPKSIENGIKFLIEHQTRDGQDSGAWRREHSGAAAEQVADLLRTCKAISAISRAICKAKVAQAGWKEACQRGVEWLNKRRCEGGGWSFAADQDREPLATCFAIVALLEAKEAINVDSSALDADFATLADAVNVDGTVGTDESLKPVLTVAALLLVRSAGKLGLDVRFNRGRTQANREVGFAPAARGFCAGRDRDHDRPEALGKRLSLHCHAQRDDHESFRPSYAGNAAWPVVAVVHEPQLLADAGSGKACDSQSSIAAKERRRIPTASRFHVVYMHDRRRNCAM